MCIVHVHIIYTVPSTLYTIYYTSYITSFLSNISSKVNAAAVRHLDAMDIARSFVSAASQSARQCRQTRTAQRKVLQEEASAKEKEKVRALKELEAQQKREEAKAAKEAAKAKRKAELEAKKKVEEETKPIPEKPDRRRRGKGMDEIGDADVPILTGTFPDRDVSIFDTMESFVGSFHLGMPSIWRARRLPTKRLLETFDPTADAKTINSALTVLKSDVKTLTSEFALTVQQNADVIKRPLPLSDQLRLDSVAATWLEGEANAKTLDYPCSVMEESVVLASLEQMKSDREKEDKSLSIQHQGELETYKHMHVVGFNHGRTFSGSMTGLWPHITYQIEGTRAVAFASLSDVSCLGDSQAILFIFFHCYCQYLGWWVECFDSQVF